MNFNRRSILKVFACLIILMIVVEVTEFSERSASAQEKGNTDPKTSCITAQCHTTMGEEKYTHGPVAVGECAICHGTAPRHKDKPERNKFAPIADAGTICFECHDKFKASKFMHTSVAEGECVSCHNPHGSDFKFLLLSKGEEICVTCHDDKIVKAKFVH